MGVFGIGSIAGSAINATAQTATNAKQRKHEKEMQQNTFGFNAEEAEKAYKRQLDYTNQYETIGAKIRQAEQAGLSRSVFASGGVQGSQGAGGYQANAGNQGTSGATAPTFDLSGIGMAIDEKLKEAEARKLNAEAKTIENTAEKEAESRINVNKSQAELNKIVSQVQNREYQLKGIEVSWAWDMKAAQWDELVERIENTRINSNYQREMTNEVTERIRKIQAEVDKIKKETDLTEAKINEIFKMWGDKDMEGVLEKYYKWISGGENDGFEYNGRWIDSAAALEMELQREFRSTLLWSSGITTAGNVIGDIINLFADIKMPWVKRTAKSKMHGETITEESNKREWKKK